MSNQVFLNPEGYIEIVLSGEQTGVTFLEVYDQAKPIIDKTLSEDKPLLGLCDLSSETKFSPSSSKVAMEYLEKIPYKKIAMYGVPHVEVTKGIIMAMGKSHNTKVFGSRKDALAWLAEK
jgi:hypothetical protein